MYLEQVYNRLDDIKKDYSLPDSWKKLHNIDENIQKYYKKAIKDILELESIKKQMNRFQ